MQQADMDAEAVLKRLASHFDLPLLKRQPAPCAAGVLVGVEIEVPWSAYFPELWERYFEGGGRTYTEMRLEEQAGLSRECSIQEEHLLPRLEATIACGIDRGRDRYWEFVLPPTNDTMLTWSIAEALTAAGLLPRGYYSMHATVSGVRSRKHAFALLFLLELLFVRKERIMQGLTGKGAWARKGNAGCLVKGSTNLRYGADEAYELRTLELPPTALERMRLFRGLAAALRLGAREASMACLYGKVERLLRAYGLPTKDWGDPRETPDPWRAYVRHFDALRHEALSIARDELDIAA